MQNSDIVLTLDVVTIMGDTMICKARDFNLDSAERRSPGSDPNKSRRALVHDQRDGLTINYDQDYPGGVTIRAVNTLEGNPNNSECIGSINVTARVFSCQGTDVVLDGGSERRGKDNFGNPVGGQRRALVHDFGDKLTLNYDGDYQAGIKLRGEVEMPDGQLKLGSAEISSNTLSNFYSLLMPSGAEIHIGDKWAWSGNITITSSEIHAEWQEQTGETSVEPRTLDVIAAIRALQLKVNDLQAELNVLNHTPSAHLLQLQDKVAQLQLELSTLKQTHKP